MLKMKNTKVEYKENYTEKRQRRGQYCKYLVVMLERAVEEYIDRKSNSIF